MSSPLSDVSRPLLPVDPPAEDGRPLGLIAAAVRRLPITGRLLLIVVINAVALLALAGTLWLAADDLRRAWSALETSHRASEVLFHLERTAYRLHREVQAFLERPDETRRTEVEAAKSDFTGALWSVHDGVDAEVRADIADFSEAARRYLFGFDDLRGLEIDITLLYDNDFVDLAAAMRERLDALDAAISPRDLDLRPLVAIAYDRFAEFRIDLVAYRRERATELLDRARRARDQFAGALSAIGSRPTPDGRSLAIELFAPDLATLDAIFARLTEIADKKARWLAGAVEGNRLAMVGDIARAVDRQEARERAAIARFDGLFRAAAGTFVAIALVFLVVSLLASLAVARSIRRPLASARAAMRAVVVGDRDTAIRDLGARDEIGAIARSIEVFRREVAGIRRRQEQHADQERRWYSVLETSPIGIAVLSAADGRVLFRNHRWDALFGALADRSPASPASWFVSTADALRLTDTVALEHGASGFQAELRGEDGGVWWGLFEVHPIEFAGRPAHIYWIYDVTDRQRAEAELRAAKDRAEAAFRNLADAQRSLIEAEKLAAIGGLVAGVAHEVNNPVGIGVTVASSLARRADQFAEELAAAPLRRSRLDAFVAATREAAQQLVANLGRAADLVQSFKQVAVDRTHADRRAFDLADATEQIAASLRPGLKTTPHVLRLDIAAGLVLDGYPGAWGQVVTNLFMNALMHAFPDGRAGTLTITARGRPNGEVAIVFADDGVGMSEETARRAFEPFFTTRRGSGGSGLGLHIVYNIVVHRLGGRIRLDTAPGAGCRFHMVLPAHAPETDESSEAEGAPT